jgi:hypothetical protein
MKSQRERYNESIFLGILIVSATILSLGINLNYFCNPNIDAKLLTSLNRNVDGFVINCFFLPIYIYYLLKFYKAKLLMKSSYDFFFFVFSFVGLIWFLAFIFQLYVFFNVHNIFEPCQSTFTWNTREEYRSSRKNFDYFKYGILISSYLYYRFLRKNRV